jgi:hypothetical protein
VTARLASGARLPPAARRLQAFVAPIRSERFTPQKSPAWVTDKFPVFVPPGIHTDMLQACESILKVKENADVIISFHDQFAAVANRIQENRP